MSKAAEAENERLRAALAVAREALEGIDDDYMTSDQHHPNYVLIPVSKFEAVRRARTTLSSLEGIPEQTITSALAETGCRDYADLCDMANVGQSLMDAIEVVTTTDGPLKDWTPAEDPAEIVGDLLQMIEDARRSALLEAADIAEGRRANAARIMREASALQSTGAYLDAQYREKAAAEIAAAIRERAGEPIPDPALFDLNLNERDLAKTEELAVAGIITADEHRDRSILAEGYAMRKAFGEIEPAEDVTATHVTLGDESFNLPEPVAIKKGRRYTAWLDELNGIAHLTMYDVATGDRLSEAWFLLPKEGHPRA